MLTCSYETKCSYKMIVSDGKFAFGDNEAVVVHSIIICLSSCSLSILVQTICVAIFHSVDEAVEGIRFPVIGSEPTSALALTVRLYRHCGYTCSRGHRSNPPQRHCVATPRPTIRCLKLL